MRKIGAKVDHPFAPDPGSLSGVPFCIFYDERGHQCEQRPEDHLPATVFVFCAAKGGCKSNYYDMQTEQQYPCPHPKE